MRRLTYVKTLVSLTNSGVAVYSYGINEPIYVLINALIL